MDSASVLRQVVRAELPLSAIESLGVQITGEPGEMRVEGAPIDGIELRLADLAAGLLRQWAMSSDLREWASLVLMLSEIQFVEAETPEEDLLLDALWSAAAGDSVSEEALALARQLAESA